MTDKERVQLIRRGNQAFNSGDLKLAQQLFIKTKYKDGLIRMGDYWFYERKKPLMAYGYYKKAGEEKKLKDIFKRMVGALKSWLDNPEPSKQVIELPQIDKGTNPLYKKALEIIEKEKKQPSS